MTREEAIKEIKSWAIPSKNGRKVLETLIPELTESEDEKIREEMIQYFTEMKKGGSAALPYDDCIAYLERQKEQKPTDEAEKFFDSVESYNQGFVAGQKKMKEDIEKGFGISEHSLDYLAGRYAGYAAARQEQEPAKWSEEDEKKINFLSRLIEFQVKDDEYCFSEGRFVSKQEAIEMLKSLRPQPKQGWSEEDKKRISEIEFAVMQMKTERQDTRDKCLTWLKSLRPQPKKELSIEKAIQWLDDTFYFLDNSSGRGRDCEITTHDFDSLEEMYDSFRKAVIIDSEPHWKPSKKQMVALEWKIKNTPVHTWQRKELESIYKELKAL